jgi:hypothetical protein
MENDLQLWNKLDEILQVELNRIDKTGTGKLNRLAKNAFDEIKAIGYELSPDNSKIELLENLSLTSLGEYRLYHNKIGPRTEDKPLVIINWQNVNYIVDGTHRINTWVANDYRGTFSIIKITPNK